MSSTAGSTISFVSLFGTYSSRPLLRKVLLYLSDLTATFRVSKSCRAMHSVFFLAPPSPAALPPHPPRQSSSSSSSSSAASSGGSFYSGGFLHTLMKDAVRSGWSDDRGHRSALWASTASLFSPSLQCSSSPENFLMWCHEGELGPWRSAIDKDVTRGTYGVARNISSATASDSNGHRESCSSSTDSFVTARESMGSDGMSSADSSSQRKKWGGAAAKGGELAIGSASLALTQSCDNSLSDSGAFGDDPRDVINFLQRSSTLSQPSFDFPTSSVCSSLPEPLAPSQFVFASSRSFSPPWLLAKLARRQSEVRSVLLAISARFKKLGYCQGLDFVVGHVLRVVHDGRDKRRDWTAMKADGRVNEGRANGSREPTSTSTVVAAVVNVSDEDSSDAAGSLALKVQAFTISCMLLDSYCLKALYFPELRLLRRIPKILDLLLLSQLPTLHNHFQRCELSCEIISIPWFQTCFVYVPSITVTAVTQILDIFIVERSFKIFFRVAIAILKVAEPVLLTMDLESMMEYLATMPGGTHGWLEAGALLKLALGIKITRRLLMRLEEDVIAAEQK